MTTSPLDLGAVRVGEALPPAVHFPTPAQLVRYAAAARDWSAIHYDADHARRRGFPGVIVHGLLKAAFLAELATDWAGPAAWVRRFAVRYRGIDLPNDPLVCRGTVTSVEPVREETRIGLELWTEKRSGEVTTVGEALVVVPGAGAA